MLLLTRQNLPLCPFCICNEHLQLITHWTGHQAGKTGAEISQFTVDIFTALLTPAVKRK